MLSGSMIVGTEYVGPCVFGGELRVARQHKYEDSTRHSYDVHSTRRARLIESCLLFLKLRFDVWIL